MADQRVLVRSGGGRSAAGRAAGGGAPGARDRAARRRRPWSRPSPSDAGTPVGPPEPVDVVRHPWAWVVGVVALLGLFLLTASAWGAAVDQGEQRAEVDRVVVPRLAGLPVAEAQRQLEQQDLLVALEYQPNEVVPAGTVFDQRPIAGAKLEVGTEVTLVVSDGPTGVPVPELRGVQGAEAAALLSALGVAAEVQQVPDEQVRPGEVVGTVPAAGVPTRPGTPVVVQVSAGPAPRTVPSVVDQAVAAALAEIGRAGLGIGTVERRYVEGRDPGLVISTDPAGGTQVARDQPVSVVVTGPSPTVRVPSFVGLTQANAQAQADKVAGLDVRVRTTTLAPGDERAGRVVRQSLPADTPVTSGTVLELVVGVVPAPTTTVPEATTTVPGSTTTTTTPRR